MLHAQTQKGNLHAITCSKFLRTEFGTTLTNIDQIEIISRPLFISFYLA